MCQNSGTHGAKRDVAVANDKVIDKQKAVADAQRVLDQKLVELRAFAPTPMYKQPNSAVWWTRTSTSR